MVEGWKIPSCSSRIFTMRWPKFRFTLGVEDVLRPVLELDCAIDGPILPEDGVVTWDEV